MGRFRGLGIPLFNFHRLCIYEPRTQSVPFWSGSETTANTETAKITNDFHWDQCPRRSNDGRE